jgi:hypothetical protein
LFDCFGDFAFRQVGFIFRNEIHLYGSAKIVAAMYAQGSCDLFGCQEGRA